MKLRQFLAARRLAIRTGIYFFAIFAISFLALLGIAYYLMSSSLLKQDRELIRSFAEQSLFRYQKDGLAGVRALAGNSADNNDIYVRVFSSDGKPIFVHIPVTTETYNLQSVPLDPKDFAQKKAFWTFVPEPGDEDQLELLSYFAGDGTVIQVGKSSSERENNLENLLAIFSSVSVVMLLVGLAASWIFASRVLRPVRNLALTMRAISQGDLAARAALTNSQDEVGELSILFNQMLERLDRLITGQRDTVDAIAHDLRTPLTGFRGLAEQAVKRNSSPEQMREAIVLALESSENLISLVSTIMDVKEAELGLLQLNRSLVPVISIVKDAVDLYSIVAEEKNLALTIAEAPELIVNVDPAQMRRATANLLDNAIKYSASNGRITVRFLARNNEVGIAVQDTGIGIAHDELPRIWAKLYRADPSRSQKGMGLGLAIVKAVVEAHGGRVEVISELNQGSTFTIWLKLA